MKKWLLFLGLVVSCTPVAQNPYITPKVQVIAHQGGEGLFPSNTMYAFERAVKMGVDMLDSDINMSNDGVLVTTRDLIAIKRHGRLEPSIFNMYRHL